MARQTIQNSNASLYLDGTSGYMTSPVVPDITGFSFGVWIKTAVRADTTEHYMSWNTTGFTDGFALIKTSGNIGSVNLQLYNGATIKGTVRAADQRNWMHIACTYIPDGTAKIYLNGVLADSAAVTGSISAATGQTLTFGKRSYGASYSRYNMNGLVWHNTTTPWTAQQVQDLYNKGTIPTGATAVYPLNEGAGSIAYDTSGNGNDGTISSGTWTRDTPTKTRKLVNNNLVYNGDFSITPPVATNVAQTGNYAWINGTSTGTSSTAEPIFGWFKYSYGGTQSAMIDTTELLNGKPSLKLSTTATSSYVGMAINSLDATYHKWNNIPCLPSTSYTASVWIKTSVTSGTATTGVQANIAQMTGTGINSAGTNLNLVTSLVTSTGWTQYTGTFTTSATARFLVPELRIVGNDGTATLIADAWFADIQLYPTTPVTRNALTFARQPVDELVRNGDFEYAPAFTAAQTSAYRPVNGTATGSLGDNLYGVYFYDKTVGTGSIQFDDTQKYTGTNSFKVSTTAGSKISAGLGFAGSTRSRDIPVLPSTSYTYSFRMKTQVNSGAANAGAFVSFTQATGRAGAYVTENNTTSVETTTDWTRYTGTITTAATANFMYILMVVKGNDGTGTLAMDAWFDNISLKLTTPTGRSAA